MPVLELNNISKSYDQKSLVVQNISFSLERDDFLVLLGPSGCGKSTILNMIAGIGHIWGYFFKWSQNKRFKLSKSQHCNGFSELCIIP